MQTILIFLKIILIVLLILLSVAYFTLSERKVLGAIQRRRGPNVVGVYGLLQPLSDGFKLLVKEIILPSSANKNLFFIAPMLTFIVSLMGWAVMPFSKNGFFAELNMGLLYLLALSSLGVYGIILSGWASNSKYSFLGALRSTAQMISYEVSIGFLLSTIMISVGSFNLQDIIITQIFSGWFIFLFFPLFLLFFISALAETNRHPFDLPEAEAELVSGYNVEYSAMCFALFSLGEYGNMLIMSSLTVILFFGGWDVFFNGYNIFTAFSFGIKVCFFVVVYAWVRAALPRFRYDQLMDLGWKFFLPISLTFLIFYSFLFSTLNILPY